MNVWDIAAGILIVREAGGLVEALEPGENPLTSKSLVAANADIFGTFADIVRVR